MTDDEGTGGAGRRGKERRRDRGLLRWSGADVSILDWKGLTMLARFDPTYLDMERQSR